MLAPERIFQVIEESGIRFFTGVPDSLLGSFCAFATDHMDPSAHVITANEGNAIALAAGWFLGTGSPALVYMQDSGLGNAVNPLTSLADPDVYGLPMLLMVGWRGAPGVPDEPQHAKQGRIMPQLLDVLEYPWLILGADTPDPEGLIRGACLLMQERLTPVVLLVRPGTFGSYKLMAQRDDLTGFPMSREAAIGAVLDLLEPDAVIVSTTGKASRELYECRAARGEGHGNDFLTVGSMGHAASIAMGIACAQPKRRVVCLDGDGSVLMHMGALAVIGQSGLTNLLHVVLNNGAHDSVGGQPTVGLECNITTIAEACGYREGVCVQDEAALVKALGGTLHAEGPVLVEVRVRKGARPELGRPKSSPAENRDALMARLGVRSERTSP